MTSIRSARHELRDYLEQALAGEAGPVFPRAAGQIQLPSVTLRPSDGDTGSYVAYDVDRNSFCDRTVTLEGRFNFRQDGDDPEQDWIDDRIDEIDTLFPAELTVGGTARLTRVFQPQSGENGETPHAFVPFLIELDLPNP